MKHIIIIPDGGGDKPLDQLGGRTAFAAASTPNLDALARVGTMGVAETTPPGFEAGSDVCSMSLLGYDPAVYHTGRAPLEAASLGLKPTDTDWIFRLNLVTTGASVQGPYHAGDDALMIDHSAGAISDAEARELLAALLARFAAEHPTLSAQMAVTPGVSYRNILIDSGPRAYGSIVTTPPHAVPGESWRKHVPRSENAADAKSLAALEAIRALSVRVFAEHPVNAARVRAGKRPATMAWLWGQGKKPSMPSFQSRFGLRGAMITAVDLLSGIAAYMGWDRLHVPGVTSYHDTDYAAQGRAAVEAVESGGYGIVCCHVEAPDEASHQADWKTKVAAIEAIDAKVVGPVRAAMERQERQGGCRVLVLPDHYTLVSTRKHDATPVPFLAAGTGIGRNGAGAFDEAEAGRTGVVVEHGHELMGLFLKGFSRE
ncbi:MAG TPA: cofactor-independent phosphoglycerate mutase [Phycisphaerales bacterium]